LTALIRAAPNLRCIELPESVPRRLSKFGDDLASIRDKVTEMLSAFVHLSTIEILCQVSLTVSLEDD
jgi:hypothetical protein